MQWQRSPNRGTCPFQQRQRSLVVLVVHRHDGPSHTTDEDMMHRTRVVDVSTVAPSPEMLAEEPAPDTPQIEPVVHHRSDPGAKPPRPGVRPRDLGSDPASRGPDPNRLGVETPIG